MDYTPPEPIAQREPPGNVVGEWYLRGFADAYAAHWAVIPAGPASEQYRRGYELGIAVVRREFFAALDRLGFQQATVAGVAYSR